MKINSKFQRLKFINNSLLNYVLKLFMNSWGLKIFWGYSEEKKFASGCPLFIHEEDSKGIDLITECSISSIVYR